MAVRKDTLFERFLAPIVKQFLIDRDALAQQYHSTDWEGDSACFRQPDFIYPDYYQGQPFHGIEGGYLNPEAAVSYDPITQYALPPSEAWVRQEGLEQIRGYPRRILDLGCGTGSTALLLQAAFPQAEVVGIDLSPYMLVVAAQKAAAAGVAVRFQQGNAEQTGWPDAQFDLITATLLFHETPPEVTQRILQEGWRLLAPGGEFLVVDGNQAVLRQVEWLTDVFEEPYIRAYAAGNLDAWMGAAGFVEVQTRPIWGMHQATHGLKPLPAAASEPESRMDAIDRPFALA